MRISLLKTLAVSAGLVLSLSAARAATISGTYSVTGSNFTSPVAPPFASITESFTISFSNDGNIITPQTSGITLNPSTITPTSSLAFTYFKGTDTLIVGGSASTPTTADPASTDFALTIKGASDLSGYSITSLTYSVGNGSVFSAQTVAKATPIATPEPASLALLGTALATLRLLRRRKAC